MNETNLAAQAVVDTVDSFSSDINALRKRIKVLRDPRIRRILQKHPDVCVPGITVCEGRSVPEITIASTIYNEDDGRGGLGEVSLASYAPNCDHYGYEMEGTQEYVLPATTRYGAKVVKVITRVVQRYSDEERAVLQGIGKLVSGSYSYTTLVCGTR